MSHRRLLFDLPGWLWETHGLYTHHGINPVMWEAIKAPGQ